MAATDEIAALEDRLARYPADRYPVQHGIAQFELGARMLGANRIAPARIALESAVRLLDPGAMRVEHARAQNALGAALRADGELERAAQAFTVSRDLFGAAQQPLEEGAATFNLGLVQRGMEQMEAAAQSFQTARGLLDPEAAPQQAGAAAREHGSARLFLGALDEAEEALLEARAIAERTGDLADLGAAANALGLVHLAVGRNAAAIDAFRDAAGAHPRTVRPDGFAMAKANLALAHERAADEVRARLCARQACVITGAPPAVTEQAQAVLDRLGRSHGDLLAVLDSEPESRWTAIVREEVQRWAEEGVAERRAESAAWIEGQVSRPEAASRLAEALLGALLELPPAGMKSVMAALLEARRSIENTTAERFRSVMSRAMAAFNPPQEARLREEFNRLATEAGEAPEWS